SFGYQLVLSLLILPQDLDPYLPTLNRRVYPPAPQETPKSPLRRNQSWKGRRVFVGSGRQIGRLRAPMRSPGRPVPSRAVQREFWRLIAKGVTTIDAAAG